MPSQGKWDKVKEGLRHLFTPKSKMRYVADGPQQHSGQANFFSNAQNFSVHNPVMNAIQGDLNIVTHIKGDRNLISHIMGLLSQKSIRGAAHDSSARSPPPRCHPQTRVQLVARITAWFNSQGRQELVLWITGPAGVGKSAVVQTFAEYLVTFELLGASVFFSRPNKRDNPHGVFITIAYQLATRIDAYRGFVVEQLSRDPELLNGDMQTQFKMLIIEPFVRKKIGAGGKRWGILLDGLDELREEHAQCEIIRLITTFAHEHPDVPLLWIIASRPESHISDTFDDDDVPRSYWSEYIPIDSTEACKDVDHFLCSGFDAIRKEFRQSFPRDWPNNTDFLKLTAAASGLFIYAQVVMHFIQDPEYSDPVSRFKVLCSVIDRSNAAATNENPFIHLDALYHAVLSSIPSNLWPTAKQLLCCTVHWRYVTYQTHIHDLHTLRGMSILFGLSPHVIYACLRKCQSILMVPDWKVSHQKNITFLHASFEDYLRDSRRSGGFYIGSKSEAANDVDLSVLAILNRCSEAALVENAWHRYCLKLDNEPPSSSITEYHANALCDIASYLALKVVLQAGPGSSVYAQLLKVHMIKISYYFHDWAVADLINDLMTGKVETIGFLRWVHLKDLKFGHLDWKLMSPARVHKTLHRVSPTRNNQLHRPCSETALAEFVTELKYLQEASPRLDVVVLGGVPQGRVAAFRSPLKDDPQNSRDFMYFMIPHPE